MNDGVKDLDFNFAILPFVAELITQEGGLNAVQELRLDALKRLMQYLNYYKKLGYVERILYGLAEKKGRMIMQISSKTEMEKLLKPHPPHFNGNEFIPDKYYVPEEELICWSETSLRAPLNDAGSKRYRQVFSEVLPDVYASIMGGAV